jgi:hypothetical protein
MVVGDSAMGVDICVQNQDVEIKSAVQNGQKKLNPSQKSLRQKSKNNPRVEIRGGLFHKTKYGLGDGESMKDIDERKKNV